MKTFSKPGTCFICQQPVGALMLTSHYKSCLKAPPPTGGKAGKPKAAYQIHVAGAGGGSIYWMRLAMDKTATLSSLDDFLRRVWLECCGHLSEFDIGGTSYETGGGMGASFGYGMSDRESASIDIGEVLHPGDKFTHTYDFGTSTCLNLTVISELAIPIPGSILVLARNTPPDIRCHHCGKPAAQVCTQCMWEGPEAWLCEKCSTKHKCGEEMLLPVVNSPRMGQCGYCGGKDLRSY